MLDKIKAVLFDLDGTLVDSMWMWGNIDVEYLGRFGIKLPDDLQSSIEGMSFSETAAYIKERFGLEDSIEQIKADLNSMAEDKYENEVPLKEGAYNFLKQLKSRGYKLGIATSNSRELVEIVTRKHGIEEFFDSIRTSCEVAKGKPSPDIYELVAKDLNVKPNECLVFEDVIQGIMAGKNAGMKVCSVEDDYSLKDKKLKQELSDYYIINYSDSMILEALDRQAK